MEELDPLLWKKLPQDLLERVIAKLPFSRAVAFRAVCKLWNTDVIPRAARVEASRKSALLYFGFYRERPVGSAWFVQLCNSKNGRTSSIEDFQPSSFPIAETNEHVRLMHSEGGLLFFAFFSKNTYLVKEIVVSNPLTAQARSLVLPRPLDGIMNDDHEYHLLVGVVMDSKSENYLLVVAGQDEADEYATFLYKSSSCIWMNGPSILPTLGDDAFDLGGGDILRNHFMASRSVCHNGNLYWNATVYILDHRSKHVIKYDVDQETWSIVLLDLNLGCRDVLRRSWQIANHEDDIFVWHLHERNHEAASSVELLFDQNYARYPQQIEWPCRNNLERGLIPEFKFMHHYEMDRVEEFLATHANVDKKCTQYFAFSQGRVLYHVLRLSSPDLVYWSSSDRGPRGRRMANLKIIAHDTIENLYTELPVLQLGGFPQNDVLSPRSVWGFAASLTSLP